LQLQPASNFSGAVAAEQRVPVTLDKSKDFKQFDSLLATLPKSGGMCLGCGRYEVSATLVGRLDGVANPGIRRDKSGKIVSLAGFGNLNEYSARLVLQSVSDVSSKEIDYSKSAAATKEEMPPMGNTNSGDTLEAVRKAVNAYGADSVPGKAIARAANAYPKPKEENGVVVTNGSLNEAAASAEGKGPRDSADGVLYNVGFNSNRLQGDALVRAMAHMGNHVADIRNPEKGFEEAGPFELEFRAWNITLETTVAYGQKTLTLPGGALLWNSAWPVGERNNEVNTALKGFLGETELLSR
jgi:hypothetical protein